MNFRLKYYYKNRKRELERQKKYHKENPHVRRTWKQRNIERVRAQNRKDKYGITDLDFRKMLKQQSNRCAICRRKEIMVDKKSGKVKLLCVDHNHKTKKIRKLLCWRCNLGIGIFRENWELLQAASNYLKTNKGIR